MPRVLRTLILIMLFSAASAAKLCAQAIPYERPVTTAPQQESIGGNYKTPEVQKPLPRGWWLSILDVVLMGAAMGAAVWIVIKRRKRSCNLFPSRGSNQRLRDGTDGRRAGSGSGFRGTALRGIEEMGLRTWAEERSGYCQGGVGT